MKASDREFRQLRWAVWHIAALPLTKRFPKAIDFIDPEARARQPTVPGAKTFFALRAANSDPVPDWVLEKFGALPAKA